MERKDIPEKYKWNLKDIFETEKDWETAFSKCENESDFSFYKGKLGNKKDLLELYKKEDELSKLLDKVYAYAMLSHDLDTGDAKNDAKFQKVIGLCTKISAETSYIVPELVALDENVLKGYIEDKDFADHDYSLKTLLKQKEHVLSAECENLLALSGNAFSQFKDAFGKIDNVDLPLKSVRHNGKTYPLTHGTYGMYMQDGDRELRKKAFKSYYKAYQSLINTVTSIYHGNVKKNVFFAKARNYSSCLEKALSGEDVSKEVYENLIKYVNSSLKDLHEYTAYKRDCLGLKKLHMYDIYTPIVEAGDMNLNYDDASKLVKEGLKVLGEDYLKMLEKAFAENWIDVEETKGKRSGAYSMDVYGVHPYVLLNYQPRIHDVFTIAHELGHSMHSYYSAKYQPYAKSSYTIFVAEVASTVNEVLLLKHVVATTKDKTLKKYLLTYFLEMIRTTLFRQTMFAEFEDKAHTFAQNGTPLTTELLNETYYELNKKYYGNAVYHDKEIAYEWARIPHFYSAFYVYKYATGIISAMSIAENILSKKENAVENYLKFLSSGGSDAPTELLKIAGVDLTTKTPYENAMKIFKDTLTELKSV